MIYNESDCTCGSFTQLLAGGSQKFRCPFHDEEKIREELSYEDTDDINRVLVEIVRQCNDRDLLMGAIVFMAYWPEVEAVMNEMEEVGP
ncbi:MAG: hypothetical protein NOU37_04865 [Candidatus Brocadiales bacterium]|nr:hypothetical protein [Candidatus Bathyanammoxibius amoris]